MFTVIPTFLPCVDNDASDIVTTDITHLSYVKCHKSLIPVLGNCGALIRSYYINCGGLALGDLECCSRSLQHKIKKKI